MSELTDDRRRALGRLGPDRQRPRPQAGALRPGHASSAPSRRRCGRRRATTGIADATFVPGVGRGGRRALGPAPAGARKLAAGARRRPLPRLADAVPPSRLLPRHGAAMGLDARAGRGRRCAQPVRLHRGRHAAAERGRRAGWSMSTRRRNRSRAARPMPRCRAWPTGRSAGSSTMPPSSPRARSGAARRYDGILLDPPKFGRGPEGEVWRLEEHLAPLAGRLPQAARRRQPLPGADRLCGAHVGAGDRRAAAAGDSPTSAARSSAARWRCARKRAGCCCRPRSSRAGR